MNIVNKRYLALVVAAALGLSACGSDGKDGQDGEDGAPGLPSPPPTVGVSEVTSIEVIDHVIADGVISFEFQALNENGIAIDGLKKAETKFAAKTEKGIVLSRAGAGTNGGYGTFDATLDSNPEGASLTLNDAGNYSFVMPMENLSAGDEGIVWLRVGGAKDSGIARSLPLVVSKPENIHTTTTQTCQSCHVNYAEGTRRHASYTAINVDGETDLVAGCLVCHNNVSRADENGGYATNTLQKIGHINHQKFERDFEATNCYTCHAEPVINTSVTGNGCTDCHSAGTVDLANFAADADFDVREMHAIKSSIVERQVTRNNHRTETSNLYWDADVTWPDTSVGAVCTDLSLYEVVDETETQLNIGELYADHTLTYAGAYIHGYDSENNTITGRAIGRGSEQYVEREDGTRSICFPELLEFEGSDGTDFKSGNFIASTRVTFGLGEQDSDAAGYTGVSLTGYSEVVSTDYFEIDVATTAPSFAVESGYTRRHAVTSDSCTTCHNSENNYHKNGSYQAGGLDCVACHNNGQNRSAGQSAPGFGPMVHSMHWGVGSVDDNGDSNSATKLNADNCVACHADGIDLYAVPNQYILARAFHEGKRGLMASPITANCFACHSNEQALNHMKQHGGEIDAVADPLWYKTKTGESCATCHDTGKTFGVEKYHVFER
ncbi:multiheme c-type cytochrome [Shewanella psychrotolerans]|uniref:multiheme c-type cytochrome n=1 Tax=Shewanella psychrotolerans TaxID=2864206 RepID=UPI001C65F257|nr:hypothetical protein [Shewanella psychrotolerans]QYK01087.1 hypothetical protein K0I62_17175 [Shewanella psychrotolerans]